MTSYLRILRSFERKNEDLKNELAAAETELGYQLLKSNFEPANTFRQSYVIMKDELNMLSDKCAEIDKLESQRSLFKKKLYDEKKKLPELEEKIKKTYLQLGTFLYENYSQKYASCFGSFYQEIHTLKQDVDSLSSRKNNSYSETEESSGFFAKLMNRVKSMPASMGLSAARKKLDELYEKAGESAFEKLSFSDGMKDFSETDEIAVFISACKEVSVEKTSVEKRIASYTEDYTQAEQNLREKEKKSQLLQDIKQKQFELDNLALNAGHPFAKQYVTRDAEILAEFPPAFTGVLGKILFLRKELSSLARRTDLVRISEQLEAAEATVAEIKKEISSNEQDIQRLQSRNAELSRRIEDAAAACNALMQHRALLELEEGISVSRMLANPEDIFATNFEPKSAVSETEDVQQKKEAPEKASGAAKKRTAKKASGDAAASDGEQAMGSGKPDGSGENVSGGKSRAARGKSGDSAGGEKSAESGDTGKSVGAAKKRTGTKKSEKTEK